LNCINARAETVDRLPSFRGAFAKRRCLIPADYEDAPSRDSSITVQVGGLPPCAPAAGSSVMLTVAGAPRHRRQRSRLITTANGHRASSGRCRSSKCNG
jgi:putative SOS response-associated peptidase YedK